MTSGENDNPAYGTEPPTPRWVKIFAIVVLVVATVLSIYKPRGVTPYGWKKERLLRAASSAELGADND